MKKQYKSMYRTIKKPQLIQCEDQIIISIKGVGGPNTIEFQKCIEALYQLSYAFRMSYKRDVPIDNYETYTVGPLEGFWGTIDNKMYDQNKAKLTYELFIVQPKFITKKVFDEYQCELLTKNPKISEISYQVQNQGLVGQILHVGPYETEDESIAILKNFLYDEGYELCHETHHEIYISDFRRTAPENLKTILRFGLKPIK